MILSLSRLRRWFSTPILPEPYRCRPTLEGLENRLVPVLNLSIDIVATANVDDVIVPGISRTFTANATGATVNVADILYALDQGLDVVVSTGVLGAEDGDIVWDSDADLIFDGTDGDLALQTSTATGDITINATIENSSFGKADLSLNLSGAANISMQAPLRLGSVSAISTGGTIAVNNSIDATNGINLSGTSVNSIGSLYSEDGDIVALASTSIDLDNIVVVGDGDITLTAPTVNPYILDINGSGNILITGNVVLENDVNVRLGDTYFFGGAGGGDVTITGNIEGTAEDRLSIRTAEGTVALQGSVGAAGQVAGLDIEANSIILSGDIDLVESDQNAYLFLYGNVVTTGSLDFSLSAPSYSTEVELLGDVTLNGTLNIFLENPSDDVNIRGHFAAGANDVTTDGAVIISGFQGAIFSGSGTLTASSVAVFDGSIAPGGVGTFGDLTIVATEVFLDADSHLLIDLGANPDELIVSGDVLIDDDALIDGTGTLTGAGPFTILSATGTIAGTFVGTDGGAPFVIGTDVVTAVYTTTTMTISPVASGPNTQKGVDASGAIYTVKLTGGGGATLTIVDDPTSFGIEGIVVKNATSANKLTITVSVNGGSPVLELDALRVGGSLALIKAPAITLEGVHSVSGYLKSATFHDVFGELTLGGTANQKTTLKGKTFELDLTMTSKLNSLTGNDFFGSINAPTIGKIVMQKSTNSDGDFQADLLLDAGSSTATALGSVNVAGDLQGDWDIRGKVGTVTVKADAFDWELGTASPFAVHPDELGGVNKITVTGGVFNSQINSSGRLATIKVGEWDSSTPDPDSIVADSIGTIKVVGNSALGLAGNWDEVDVTVTGFVNPGRVALKTFSAKGEVFDSTFDIQDGNVTSFVVGKFIDSRLYLGLSAGGSLTTGTFGANNFKLGTFKTTTLPFDPPNVDDGTVAFVNSEVCAARFGTVRLSSVLVDNGGEVFGLRVATAAGAGSVRVATVPFGPPFNVNLVPNAPPATLQDDFAFFFAA